MIWISNPEFNAKVSFVTSEDFYVITQGLRRIYQTRTMTFVKSLALKDVPPACLHGVDLILRVLINKRQAQSYGSSDTWPSSAHFVSSF